MKIHELLSDKSKWTQGHYALRADGNATSPILPDAICWCIVGAAHVCYPGNDEWMDVLIKIGEHTNGSVARWNDDPSRTYEEVVELLRKVDV